MGNKNEKMLFHLNFLVKNDSIIIYREKKIANPFASFKIISTNCNWNKDFSEGYSSFKLISKSNDVIKYPTLNIDFQNPKNRYVELLYENDDPRIFTIEH